MSNDEYAWPDGCFFDWENVEVRRNSKEVILNVDPYLWNGWPYTIPWGTSSWEITCFSKYYDSASTYTFLCWTSIGKVFDVSWRTISTFTFGGSTWYPILNIWVIQDYSTSGAPWTRYGFLIDARGGLYRWTWANTADAWLLGTTYSPTNLLNPGNAPNTTQLWPTAPYIITSNTLIYWVGNLIYVFDLTKSPWALSIAQPIQIDKGYTIKWITKIDSQIIIYTANDTQMNTTTGFYNSVNPQWNTQGKVYYYSFQGLITSNPPDRTIDWKDRPILWVVNKSNIDYVVVWSAYRRAIYRNDGWYSPTLLYQTWITTDVTSRFFIDPRFSSNSLGSYWNLILMPAKNYVYTYWSVTNWLPESLVKEIELSLDSSIRPTGNYTVSSFFVDDTTNGSRLYMGLRNLWESNPPSTIYFAPFLNNTGINYYRRQWYIEINPIVGDWVFQKKRPVKCEVSYKLETGTYLVIYTNIDDNWYNTSYNVGGSWYGKQVLIMNNEKDFYKIKFKIELNWNVNWTVTPHLFTFRFIYDAIEDEMT